MNSITPKVVALSAIKEKFDLSQYDVISNLDKGNVIFLDGETVIDGDLDTNYTDAIDTEAVLVFVHGNLTVNGDIIIRDYKPWLLVTGDVSCEVLYSGDNIIHITGNAAVKHAFYGYYNDGSITVEGTTNVPYVLNSDHHSAITPEDAILINVYSDDNDFFEYDYTTKDLAAALLKSVMQDSESVNVWKFIAALKAGKSPFKKTAKPPKVIYQEQIGKLLKNGGNNITELDLTDKKLDAFPVAITKLVNLRKLVLSDNNIETLPEEIGRLEQLEELYIRNCDLQQISPAISQLRHLRILDISSNYNLRELPATFGQLPGLKVLLANHVQLRLPETFQLPDSLEEISLFGSYKDLNKAFSFPMALTKLKHLKSLDLRENYFHELPDAILNIQSLEAFLWTGSRTDANNFPDFTKFSNLKKLVISRKLLSWKEDVFNIPTLEHLEIDRNREEKEYIDEFTIDIWSEMAEENPKKFGHLPALLDRKRQEPDGRFSIIVTPGITPDDIRELNRLPKLKYLDISFNELPYLPETIYELKSLEYIDLRYNCFSEAEQNKIVQQFPGVKIEF
ncbi:leucine-rich repeat domain-containing protein [Chitinophaga rhizophila]|uniref:Leucine-rich repeat domain-containing protein n=1 Tax=Chitinophaga rhizophila TaxID=2866212 RepID=A0ABS7GGN4_9BACT|nr:leucine-rich repeat domain-containing protein [Chitinophaga rhizophila]MBW8686476.1 leucine-rich repeat domain-containing protein [Chitinophaga rhizophila]